ASTASRPLSWASETTLRTFARAAMARSFHGIVCCKRNVDTKVPRGTALRAMLTSLLARVDCELPGGPKTIRPVMPPAPRRRGCARPPHGRNGRHPQHRSADDWKPTYFQGRGVLHRRA